MDTQLDTEVIDNDLHNLAGYFDNYNNYLDKLKLTRPECEDVKSIEYRQGHQSAMREALRLWRTPNPSAATFRALLDIALSLGKQHVAEDICKYVSENIPA